MVVATAATAAAAVATADVATTDAATVDAAIAAAAMSAAATQLQQQRLWQQRLHVGFYPTRQKLPLVTLSDTGLYILTRTFFHQKMRCEIP